MKNRDSELLSRTYIEMISEGAELQTYNNNVSRWLSSGGPEIKLIQELGSSRFFEKAVLYGVHDDTAPSKSFSLQAPGNGSYGKINISSLKNDWNEPLITWRPAHNHIEGNGSWGLLPRTAKWDLGKQQTVRLRDFDGFLQALKDFVLGEAAKEQEHQQSHRL